MGAYVEGWNHPPPSSAMLSSKAVAAHGSRQKLCKLLNMYMTVMRRGRVASESNVSLSYCSPTRSYPNKANDTTQHHTGASHGCTP